MSSSMMQRTVLHACNDGHSIIAEGLFCLHHHTDSGYYQ